MKKFILFSAGLVLTLNACSKPQLAEETTRYSSGESKTSTYTYLPNGEIDTILVEPSYSTWTLYEYEYDEQGNNSSITREYSGGYLGKKEFVYDDQGRLIEDYWISLSNEQYVITYDYDAMGELNGEYHFYSDGHWISHLYLNAYDDHDKLISQTDVVTTILADTEMTNVRTNVTAYHYNRKGLKSTETKTESGGFVTAKYFQYDGKGRLTLESQTNSLQIWETTEYDYNSRGDLSEKRLETSGGMWNTTTYRYE